MDFSVESIKRDLKALPEKDFLIRYLLRSDNWYFSEYQGKSEADSIAQMDTLKGILTLKSRFSGMSIVSKTTHTGCKYRSLQSDWQ